jgi:hypothetical protein
MTNCTLNNINFKTIRNDNSEYGLRNVKLENMDLSGYNLSDLFMYYIDLSGSNLSNTNLSGSKLNNANLTNSILSPETILTNTDFSGVILNNSTISNVDFSGSLNLLYLVNINNGINVINIGNNVKFPTITNILQENENKILIKIIQINVIDNTIIYELINSPIFNVQQNNTQNSSINSLSKPLELPTGVITLNVTQQVLNSLPKEINGNIARLIPVNVLRIALASGAVINIL